MNYFRGRILRNLDPKGRLMLPPGFRDILAARSAGGKTILTTYDGCLVAYPQPDWEIFEDKLGNIKTPTRPLRDFRRLVLGGAEEMAPDPQGRIRLSRAHLQYAAIDREAMIVGQGPRFEVWSPERLGPILERTLDDVAGVIAESGLDLEF
jgi:MraZ protein